MSDSLFPNEAPHQTAATGCFIAHCDGGSRGNPGPAGFGAVIQNPGGQVAARLSEFLGRQTNNYAEYAGLLAVLKWAQTNGVKHLRVVSDSELMVRQMKGIYKVSNPRLRPMWEEARRLAGGLERFEIGHTLRGGNAEADRLANEAMDRGMGKSSGGSAGGVSGVPKAGVPRAEKLEGYVKDGVIHLLEGELPEGTFVMVLRKETS